jgi:hypothetical protein
MAITIEIKLDEDSRIVQALLEKGMDMDDIEMAVAETVDLIIHERVLIDEEEEIIGSIEMNYLD